MNYTDSNDTDELLNFIKKKKELKETTYPSQLIYFFSKAIKASLVNTYKEQNNLDMALHCANIVNSIFILIYNYSYNIKLSMFICERSILLFNEYINISKSYNSDAINIVDIKQFIINKSIGPLEITSNNSLVNNFILLLDTIKEFICNFFITKITKNSNEIDINFYIETIIRILSTSLIDLYNNELLGYIESELLLLNTIEIDNILENVYLLKIKFEIFLYLLEKKKKEYIISNIDSIIKNNIYVNKLLIEFNEDENIKDSKNFKKIIKNI